MKQKEIGSIIKKNLVVFGTPCKITKNSGEVINTFGVTHRFWKNDKSKQEAEMSPIGKNCKNYISCFLPADIDLKGVDENDIFSIDNRSFYFVRCDFISTGKYVTHYHIIGREIKEAQDVLS